MNNNVFTTNEFGKEVLSKNTIACNGNELVLRLIVSALVYGIDRIESAIDNTFTKGDANTIKVMMNTATKFSA